jgi:hypothetical protein
VKIRLICGKSFSPRNAIPPETGEPEIVAGEQRTKLCHAMKDEMVGSIKLKRSGGFFGELAAPF